MANAAMLVIGDEILSGRTQDTNMHHLAGALARHGVPLAEARVIADDHATIIAAVTALSAAYTHVFTSGGIGPTHDDITADAVAAAFDARLDVREDARTIMAAHYAKDGRELNEARLRMARIPDGATLIDNPVSAAPGFTLGNVHVMAGVPQVFEAMVASVLPTIAAGRPVESRSVTVERGEGDVAGPIGTLAQEFPDLSVGSYPQYSAGVSRVSIVVRGTDAARLDAAMARLAELVPEAC